MGTSALWLNPGYIYILFPEQKKSCWQYPVDFLMRAYAGSWVFSNQHSSNMLRPSFNTGLTPICSGLCWACFFFMEGAVWLNSGSIYMLFPERRPCWQNPVDFLMRASSIFWICTCVYALQHNVNLRTYYRRDRLTLNYCAGHCPKRQMSALWLNPGYIYILYPELKSCWLHPVDFLMRASAFFWVIFYVSLRYGSVM